MEKKITSGMVLGETKSICLSHSAAIASDNMREGVIKGRLSGVKITLSSKSTLYHNDFPLLNSSTVTVLNHLFVPTGRT